MDVTQVNEFLRESVNEYYGRETPWEDYLRGKLSLAALIKKAGGLSNIATKKDLEEFLGNKFLIDIKAHETRIKKSQIVAKVKALLKRY